MIDVSADTYATFREAQARLRRESDASLSEEDGLLLMARAVLGGPDDAGRSSYQVRMTQCATCLATEQEGKGAGIPVEPAVAEMANCDGRRYEGTGAATQSIPPAVRRFVVSRQHGRCGVPGCSIAVFTDVHHVTFRSDGGTHDPDGLFLICSLCRRALHRGMLRIDGTWSTGLRFSHANGRPYGFMDSPGRDPFDTPCPHGGVSA